MGTFSRIFGLGDKDLQEKAEKLLLSLSKSLQKACAKLHALVECWDKGNEEKVKEIAEEIIEVEREADETKDALITSIFAKHAYLPQQTEERYDLITKMDHIIDAAEEAARIILAGFEREPPKEIVKISEKCWYCTDLLQDAIKYIFSDFEKSIKYSRKIEDVREEARNEKFELIEDICEGDYKPIDAMYYHLIATEILEVAIRAETTADLIRAIAVRYI
ncbi:DUF47 family protein [Candidatus Thorarchaeota archaeon]|nr:MAG: DUF47 family protein [Candidatus Thorarchaeota archaeon]